MPFKKAAEKFGVAVDALSGEPFLLYGARRQNAGAEFGGSSDARSIAQILIGHSGNFHVHVNAVKQGT